MEAGPEGAQGDLADAARPIHMLLPVVVQVAL